MNTMNDLINLMQLASAVQNSQVPKFDSGRASSNESSEFDKMLHSHSDKQTATKPADESGKGEAADAEESDVLQEIAAAMTMMSNVTALPQIQPEDMVLTQPIQTAPVELVQQVQAEASPVQGTAAEQLTQTVEQTAGQADDFGQSDAAGKAQVAQPAVITQEEQQAQPTQTVGQSDEVPQTVRTETAESAGSKQEGDLKNGEEGWETLQTRYGDVPAEHTVFETVKEMPVKVGEAPVVDTLAGDLEAQLAKQISTGLDSGAQQIKIQLAPEHLGTLTIELTRMQDGALQVVLHATTEKAANLLSSRSGELGAMLQSNTQATVQVEVQRQENTQQYQQQNQQHGEQGRQQQNPHRQRSEDFMQQLRLGLVSLSESEE